METKVAPAQPRLEPAVPAPTKPWPKTKASVKARYEGDKAAAVAALNFPLAGNDLRFKATATDATFSTGPSLRGLSLSVEKPGSFMIDLNPNTQDLRFQFMNTARVMDKPLSLTYIHSWPVGRASVDCGLTFDPANKVTVSHALGSGGCRIKYLYSHGTDRRTVIEPCFDTIKNSWDFAVSKKIDGGDAVKATYHASTKVLGLEWSRDSKITGSFKVSASFNLAEENKAPKLMAESTWNYEM